MRLTLLRRAAACVALVATALAAAPLAAHAQVWRGPYHVFTFDGLALWPFTPGGFGDPSDFATQTISGRIETGIDDATGEWALASFLTSGGTYPDIFFTSIEGQLASDPSVQFSFLPFGPPYGIVGRAADVSLVGPGGPITPTTELLLDLELTQLHVFPAGPGPLCCEISDYVVPVGASFVTPEPATLALVAGGGAVLALAARRRRR